jgi:quercetin dioxygenase-like cupin family protein
MRKLNINDMIRGWFVGDFEPTALKTQNCEVSYRSYKAGDSESKHYHKIATELTVITSGKVLMNGVEYSEGDIVVIEPGDITDFQALTDATNVVVKVPGAKDDKYLA